ncbi:MAG: class I SAM-dependent methyltransferase [Candidatus Binatia bacterium]|nr:class I SAM-dependent methyltransferase [Candidatus Binatia bacterium]
MTTRFPYEAMHFTASSHQKLLQYAMSHKGLVFGTEFTGTWLYSLLRMQGCRRVIELGTGFGVSALWCALAMRENPGDGHVWTYDGGEPDPDFLQLAEELGLQNHLTFEQALLYPERRDSKLPVPTDEPLDLVWSDIAMGRNISLDRTLGARNVVEFYLPYLSDRGWILVDNGPPIEEILPPEILSDHGRRRFSCFRILKSASAQNATSVLHIEPHPAPDDISPWVRLDEN